jgi:hypothetical protein
MSPSTKCGVLMLAALGGWALSEFDLVSRAPQETTAAALRQFQDSDADAERLREADAAKNGWLAFWPLLLVVLAGLLFWDDAMKLCNPPSRGMSEANPADRH